MPLTLEKYAELLDKRGEPCPAGPEPQPFARVKPSIKSIPGIRGVVFGGYGAALLIGGGKFHFLNPDRIMRKIALDKTVREFKMWASMTRKPGEPAEYMETIFQQVYDALMMLDSQQKDSELRIEKVWENIIQRLIQKDYLIESGTYGELPEFARKVSYFYVRASQGASLLPGAAKTFQRLAEMELALGLHANWQCTEPVRFWRQLAAEARLESLDQWFAPDLCVYSGVIGCKKHVDRGFIPLLAGMANHGLEPESVLYVGSDIEEDIAAAKRRGFRTALLLADQTSSNARPEHLQDSRTRPDRLLTAIEQVLTVAA